MTKTLFVLLNIIFVGYTLYLNVPKVAIILRENDDKHLQYFTYFGILSLGISYYLLYKVVISIAD